jgi:hypothetical protein
MGEVDVGLQEQRLRWSFEVSAEFGKPLGRLFIPNGGTETCRWNHECSARPIIEQQSQRFDGNPRDFERARIDCHRIANTILTKRLQQREMERIADLFEQAPVFFAFLSGPEDV